MFFANLIKFLLIFLFIYLVFNLFRTVLAFNRRRKNINAKRRESFEQRNNQYNRNNKVIELTKDEYKVE